MIKKLKKIYAREQFIPSFWSIFINPYFFLRKGLLKGISAHSYHMKGVMLDFGCGCKPYEELFNVDKYIGLDIEQRGHNHTNEKIDVFYDGKTIPFKSKYFDSFFSSEVFEHIFNLEEILLEINRVLKIGSKILITVPFVWDEHEKPCDYARYTSFGISFLMEKYGFKVIKIDKSTNSIETIFQMINTYIHQKILPWNKYLKFVLTLLFISPINIFGLFLSKILPKDYGFYNNNIILAEKTEDVTIKRGF